MKSKYKKLFGNSIIFAIGNLGSKLMQFIMVPIYSYTLTTTEFGKVDVITSLIALLLPIVCFDIFDAAFRFALDKNENKIKILSSSLMLSIVSSIFVLIVSVILSKFIKNYPVMYAGIFLIVSIFYSLISNFARAIGFVKEYAISGIINTLGMGICNILLLVVFHTGMNGYMLSLILGQFITIIYLLISTSIKRMIILKSVDFHKLNDMLKYSLPLIPNTLAWWLNSTSDRFFIIGMIGASANGIYAMASKIPSFMSTFTSIFYQSWQISVVEEFDKKNSKDFINSVFEGFVSLLFLTSFLLIGFIRPIFKLIINNSYYEGWTLGPLLFLAVIYTSIASFLGTVYTASKKTTRVLITTIYGAILNVLLTVVLIKVIGIYGAAIANSVSFFVVSLLRYRDIYKAGKLGISFKNIIILHILFFIESFLLFYIYNDWIMGSIGIAIVIIQLLLDKILRKMLFSIIKGIKVKILK